jgi:putative DNA primase/helicase
MPKSKLSCALYYAKRGWPVIPLFEIADGCCTCSAGKECGRSSGKHPRTQHGLNDATTDPDQIRAWWGKWPNANVGVRTGRISGILVIDADPRNGANETSKVVRKELGPLPRSPKASSGGGGRHYVFQYPGFEVRSDNQGKLLGPGLDVLSDGHHFVAPESNHLSGNTYRWVKGHSPDDIPPAALPETWLECLRRRPSPPVRKVRGDGATDVLEGQRNTHLTRLAGRLWRGGISVDGLLAALLAENERRCKPSLDQSEVERIANSIAKYPTPKALDGEADLAEQVLQLVLEQHFPGGHLMYYGDGQFWRFDGRKWKPFREQLLDKCVLRTIKNIPHKQSSTSIIGQVRLLARAQLATGKDLLRFEGDPAPVINCQNGELWIAEDGSVKLRPHNAKSYLRYCLDVAYDPKAKCLLYDRTVLEIFAKSPDPEEMVRHWHEFVGYIISQRRNIPLIIPICLGSGNNSKTKLLETAGRLLGPDLVVRPEGANHQWRKIPPGELSIDPVANERLGWVTGRAGAS